MNEFIMLNWYHFDLNYRIINQLKRQKIKKENYKRKIKHRIDKDFKLKIKKE